MPQFQSTQYFRHIMTRPDRAQIREGWIVQAIRQPERPEIQADGRIRRWARISECGGRALRDIRLPDKETAHNAFFDRRFEQPTSS